jgi:nucleoside-triphosphatase THEP1
MVLIITGPMDSGKTTRFLSLYDKRREGDGFASVKDMEGHEVTGFTLMRLSTGKTRTLCVHHLHGAQAPDDGFRFGPYVFDNRAFDMVRDQVEAMVRTGMRTIWLDEIGRLELEGHGFDKAMRTATDAGAHLVITVRDTHVDDVIRHYGLKDITIITV